MASACHNLRDRVRNAARWQSLLLPCVVAACSSRPIVSDGSGDAGASGGADAGSECEDGVHQVGEFCDDRSLGGCHVCFVSESDPEKQYTFVGEQPYDIAGGAVALVGDMDGDGQAEVLIGAHSNSEAGVDAGKAYLMLSSDIAKRPGGTEFNLGTDASYAFVGEAADDGFGHSIADAGDVDADGRADLLFAAPRNGAGAFRGGKAYLMLAADILAKPVGTTFSMATSARHTFLSDIDLSECCQVSSAGDVDGDGLDDVLLGHTPDTRGIVHLMLGADLLESPPQSVFSLATDSSYVFLGQASTRARRVASAGDVDADGRDDILIGGYSTSTTSTTGTAYLMFGRDILAQSPGHVFGLGNERSHRFVGAPVDFSSGLFVAGAGDVDGDGADDILLGAPSDRGAGWDAGASYLVLASSLASEAPGASLDLETTSSYRFVGADSNENSGLAVASAGDIDGDGNADLLIGAPNHDITGDVDDGDVGDPFDLGKVYLMRASDVLARPAGHVFGLGADASAGVVGEGSQEELGTTDTIAGGGDVDGDGKSDLLIAVPGDDAWTGKVYLRLSPF